MELHAHLAVGLDEVDEVDDAPVGRLLGRRCRHRDAGRLELAGQRLHVVVVADLPPDVRDVLGVGGVDREAVVVAVHLEEEVLLVAVVGDLVAEDLDRVLLPLVEIRAEIPT